MNTVLKIENGQKKYGTKKVLENINLEIHEGEIIALLGENGCGKTTLLKIMSGLLNLNSGSIFLENKKYDNTIKESVSYLPDNFHLYNWMSIKDAKNYYNDFFKDFRKDVFMEYIGKMNLDLNEKVDKLSKGNKEKLTIALTFARDSKIYLLDEPFAGIDPFAREEIFETIINKGFDNKTIIISTQILHQLSNIIDRVLFIKNKQIIQDIYTKDVEENGENLEKLFIQNYRR